MTAFAHWRVLYRLLYAADDDPWLVDGDYTHEEAVKRVFEIRANTEEGELDAYTTVRPRLIEDPELDWCGNREPHDGHEFLKRAVRLDCPGICSQCGGSGQGDAYSECEMCGGAGCPRGEMTDLRCSVCGSLEIAVVNGANEAHCLAHLPDQWRPLFEPPIFDPRRTL